MKKIFSARSLIALFLLVSMLLSLLCACTKDEDKKSSDDDTEDCTEHIDENKDAICDNCEADIPYTGDVTGTILSNAIINQFEKAQSLKMDLTVETILDQDLWYSDYDENFDPLPPENTTWYSENITTLSAVISKTADGGANVRVDVKEKYRCEKDEEFETYEYSALYLVDGVVYTYDETLDAYLKRDLAEAVDIEELESMLNELIGKIEITEDEKNAVIAALGDLAITAFNIKDNKGSISIDLKPIVEDIKAYVDAIDLQNDTLSDLLNEALALISEDLTAASILTEIERIAGLTVNEALAEIDAMLTESYGMTLQGLYDMVVNNPEFVKALTEMLKEQYSEDLSKAEVDVAVSAMITNMQSIKIADLISQYGIGDIVIYDLITMLAASEDSETEIPTLSEFFDGIEAILTMTLGEFEEMIEMPIFSAIKESFSSLTVNEISAKLDVNFKGVLNIDTIEGKFNYDVFIKEPSEDAEGKFDVSATKTTATLKIYDISKEMIDISIPTDKNIY